MKPVYNLLEYLDADKVYTFSDELDNQIEIKVYIQIHSEKFVEYQKEILQEFVADFTDKAKDVSLSSNDIEMMLEGQLQLLNAKLQSFADKLRDAPKCDLRGYVQLILDNSVKTWMIGKTTLMIFRNDKLYSVLENSFQEQTNIDQFSDFIGGELERGDVFLYAGTKLSEVLDQNDFSEMEQVLAKENANAMLDHLDDLFASRVEKKGIWFLGVFSITGIDLSTIKPKGKLSAVASKYTSKLGGKLASKVGLMKRKKQTSQLISGHKYYLMVGVLVVAILFLGGAVLSQLKSAKKEEVYFKNASGSQELITIDSIRNDILAFQAMDPSSDEKSLEYNRILSKLSLLAEKGLWEKDVKDLKNIIDTNYQKGFNVSLITNLSQFDDEATGRKTRILTFNDAEKAKLGTPISIDIGATTNIGGTQAALIGVINDATRGNLIEYNVGSAMKDCELSLGTRGLFCYAENGDLFFVNKLGVEQMEVVDEDRATKNIGGIWTYGRNNFYLFQANPNNIGAALLTRYRNLAGSESKYQNGTNYSILAGSGASLPQQLGGFAIDGNFLGRGGGKLYQFRRSSNIWTALDYREVPIIGGDKVGSLYSDNVKIIATDSSPFIYLFDKDNQTFTVYESSPVKTNDNYKTNFRLYYLFRFKFNLAGTENRILDVAVPESTADRPELHLLSNEGVNKINLYDFIDSIKNNKNLKSVNNAS